MIPPSFSALALLTTTLLLHSTPLHAHPQPNPFPVPKQNIPFQNLAGRQYSIPSPPACCSAAANLVSSGSTDAAAIQAQIDTCYRPGGCAYSAMFAIPSTVGPTPTPVASGYVYTLEPVAASTGTPPSPPSDGGAGGVGGGDNTPSSGDSSNGSGSGYVAPYGNGTVVDSGSGMKNVTTGSGTVMEQPASPPMNMTDASGRKENLHDLVQEMHDSSSTGGKRSNARFVRN